MLEPETVALLVDRVVILDGVGEAAGRATLDREQADPGRIPFAFKRRHARPGLREVAHLAGSYPPHDLGIGVDGGERDDIGLAPAAEHEHGRLQRHHPVIVPRLWRVGATEP